MNIYELFGFIMGDGNIYYKPAFRQYRLELCGNISEDYDYFQQIKDFLINETGKTPLLFTRVEEKGNSLRIQFNNKEFVNRLILLGLPKGKKTFSITIPESLLKEEFMFSILRGLFEADGCLYFSKSKNKEYPDYPRLEIKTSSERLVSQIESFLKSKGFNVYIKKPVSDRTFAIVLSGKKMLQKWINKVGFVSLKNRTKHQIWESKGFYIPNTPLKERLKLCGDGTAATAVDI